MNAAQLAARDAAPFLRIDDDLWRPTGPEDDHTARLLTSIKVNGLMMHLEAIAVEDAPAGEPFSEQVACHPIFAEDLERLHFMQDTTFETVEIMGRQYVLVATPFGD